MTILKFLMPKLAFYFGSDADINRPAYTNTGPTPAQVEAQRKALDEKGRQARALEAMRGRQGSILTDPKSGMAKSVSGILGGGGSVLG